MRFIRKSLATKFIVTAIVLTLIPMLIVGSIGFLLGKRGIETHTDLHLQSVVSLKEEQVANRLLFLRNILATNIYPGGSTTSVESLLSTEPDSQAHKSAAILMEENVMEMVTVQPWIKGLVLLDGTGRIQYSGKPEILGESRATERFFQEGSQGLHIALPLEETHQQDGEFLTLSQPARGDVNGVVVLYVDPAALTSLFHSDPGLGETGRIYLVQSGTGVIASDGMTAAAGGSKLDTPDLVSTTASSRYTGLDGEKVVGRRADVANLPWSIVAEIPAKDAFSDVGDMRLLIIITLAIVGVGGSLIAWKLSNTITKPLKEAAAGALAIGTGDLGHRISVRSTDEVGELASSFNQMARDMAQAREDLVRAEREAAVRETSELILQGAPISLLICDEEANLVAANETFYGTFGLVKEASEGRPIGELVKLDDLGPVLNRSKKERSSYQGTHLWTDPTGALRHFAVSANSIAAEDAHGLIIGLEDITDRVAAEMRYQQLMENANDGVFVIDVATGQIQEANPMAADLLGAKSVEEVVGRDVTTIHPDSMKHLADKHLQDTLERGSAIFDDLPILRQDGSTLDVQVSAKLVELGGQKVIHSVLRDVSEQKVAERALRESEGKFRSLIDHAADAFFLIDLDGRFVDVNQMASETLGYTREQLLELSISDVETEFELTRLPDLVSRLEQGAPVTLSGNHQHIDGSTFPVEVRIGLVELEGRRHLFALARDVSERTRAEHELRLRSTALQAASNGIVITDREGTIEWVNPAFTTMTGYTADEAIGNNMRLLRSGKQDNAFYGNLWNTILSGHTWESELVNRRKDGSLYHEEESVTPVRDSDGEIAHFIAIKRDITERKRGEEALQDSEIRFRELFDEAPVGYCELDSEGRIRRVNRTELKMLGQSVWEFVADEEFRRILKARFTEGKFPTPAGAVECVYRRKDGTTIDVLIEERLLRNDDGLLTGVRCTIQDITERMQETARLASVGELAAGVAHEINNPLTVVTGFSEVLMAENLPQPLGDYVQRIHSEGQRSAKIVQNLLSFSRRHEPEKRYLDVSSVLEQARELKAYDFRVSNIQVTSQLAPDFPSTMVDEHQLMQVIMNILTNAEQAMIEAHGGGELVLRTAHVGDAVRISITDNGPGMHAEDMGRIFDPFYTTSNCLESQDQ